VAILDDKENKMKYTWRKQPDDGWGCKNLYMGTIRVGGYVHSLIRNPVNEYIMRFALPTMVDIGDNDPKVLMQKAEVLCDEWLKKLNEEN